MNARTVNPEHLVDPELRPILTLIRSLIPPVESMTPVVLAQIRARGVAMSKPFLSDPPVTERRIPGRSGDPGVGVFVIGVRAGARRPAILHLHGGGYVAGSARGSVTDMQVIARALDCVVVTVEYRLAPETAFPGALEDNLAALAWMRSSADELGIDPARIALMGESAGGGHAAALALAVRDRELPPPLFLALTYPMLDDRTGSTRTVPEHLGAFLWRPVLNVGGWTALLGTRAGGEAPPQGAVPARADDLGGLPPTWIGTGALDLFVAENLDFARRLAETGVPVELTLVPGAFHGFDVLAPLAGVSRRFRLGLLNALARAFGGPELDQAPQPAAAALHIPDEAPTA